MNFRPICSCLIACLGSVWAFYSTSIDVDWGFLLAQTCSTVKVTSSKTKYVWQRCCMSGEWHECSYMPNNAIFTWTRVRPGSHTFHKPPQSSFPNTPLRASSCACPQLLRSAFRWKRYSAVNRRYLQFLQVRHNHWAWQRDQQNLHTESSAESILIHPCDNLPADKLSFARGETLLAKI